MPSWTIHLALANKLNKKMNLCDDFLLGNILPDVLDGYIIKKPSHFVNKNESHFKNECTKKIDIDLFISKYKNKFNNPIVLGYLSHLVADKYFNDYFHSNHTIKKDNKIRTVLKNGSLDSSEDKPWQIKQRDFERFGQMLLNNNGLSDLTICNINIKNFVIDEVVVDNNDLHLVRKTVKKMLNNKNIYNPNNYEVFTENELNLIFNNCYKEILAKLKAHI